MGPQTHATPITPQGANASSRTPEAGGAVRAICRGILTALLIAAAGAAEAQTFTPIATKTATNTPSPSPTATAFMSPTNTPTISPTPTITPTATNTPTPFFCCQCAGFCAIGPAGGDGRCPATLPECTSVMNGVCVSGGCLTATPTRTPANTATITPTVTATFTRTFTPTVTPTATVPMNIDPYKCYLIKGKAAFKRKTVTLVDQFQTKRTVLLKPIYLCNPSGKGDAGGQNVSALKFPDDHLVCYTIRDESKPKFNPREVTTRNQIVPEEVNVENFTVKKSKLLCLPSSKQENLPPTNTPTRTPTGPTVTPTSTPTS